MLFTVGVETPKKETEAFGMVVPALFTESYSCFSAADSIEDIVPMVTDAIHSMLEVMLDDGFDISTIKDKGFTHYKTDPEFEFCDTWLLVNVDITAYFGKRQRINITLPQHLLERIDQRVSTNPSYKDRSHFLAVASQKELSSSF